MSENSNTNRSPIAVVGVSSLFPGSSDTDGFWSDILAGSDLMKEIPEDHWLINDYFNSDPAIPDSIYCKRGAFLDSVDFDPVEWGIPPSNMASTDTSQMLALIVARRVLEDAAKKRMDTLDRDRISVILGVASATELVGQMASRIQRPVWVRALREHGMVESEVQRICDRISASYSEWKESTFPGLLGNVIAGRIANRLDLGGTNCVIDAACASSLAALSMSIQELRLGHSDLVITGGVDALNDIFMFMCFSKTPALSPTMDCRPFSADADGTMLGEGLGMLALRRLEDAERDGDEIYAVIRGLGSSSDGRSKSVYAPVSSGQAKALRRAYAEAGYGPETVELLEAHGTATVAGDAAEFGGLREVFGAGGESNRQWCALGSVKSQIGHTKAAAGSAAMIKTVLALRHRTLPPTIKVDRPNPNLDIENSPFYLNTEKRPWIRDRSHPRRASVSSFGFGGSNFHVTLEEYIGSGQRAARRRTFSHELFILAADSPDDLGERLGRLKEKITDRAAFLHQARESLCNYNPDQSVRLAIIARDAADFSRKTEQIQKHLTEKPDTDFSLPAAWHYRRGEAGEDEIGPAEIAFLFSGQGSQYTGMGTDVAIAFADAGAVWDRLADLELDPGKKLHEVVYPRPVFSEEDREKQESLLRETTWAQPAIGAVSLSLLAVLRRLGIGAQFLGGHSFGELTALHAAGAFSEEDFIRAARKRGELMAGAASEPGAMTAVFLNPDELTNILKENGRGVILANDNSPGQAVLAGRLQEIEKTENKLRSRGVEFRRLPVATAFHSEIVAAAAEPYRQFLSELNLSRPAGGSVYCNIDAAVYGNGVDEIRDRLALQITSPVLFREQIETMYRDGARIFIEVGPGAVLTRLTAECLADRPHQALALDNRRGDSLATLLDTLGKLTVLGVRADLLRLWDDYEIPTDPELAEKPRLALPINGSNYQKPYPPSGGEAQLPPPNPESMISENVSGERTSARANEVGRSTASSFESRESVLQSGGEPNTGNARHSGKVPHTGSVPHAGSVLHAENVPDYIRAFEEIQRETARSHQVYQKSLADAHQSYLLAAQSAFQSLNFLLTGSVAGNTADPNAVSPPRPADPARNFTVDPFPAVQTPADSDRFRENAPQAGRQSPAQRASDYPSGQSGSFNAESDSSPIGASVAGPATASPVGVGSPLPTIVPTHSAGLSAQAIHDLLMETVAEKTGYPVDMLEPEMELESGLGIDSIKRVQILSALQSRAPGLPEVDAKHLGALRTLGEIIKYMEERLRDSGTAVSPSSVASDLPVATASTAIPATNQAASAVEVAAPPQSAGLSAQAIHDLLMETVAEKTGYPVEMLEPEMELESGLGIDSIKRVQILSAMQGRAPGLPEVDAKHLGALRTLGEIIKYMEERLSESRVAAPSTSVAVSAAPPRSAGLSAQAIHDLLMATVAEKTGYPVEMLEPEMELESGLGIDSIKRVQILSAMQSRAPELPEVDAKHLGTLRTLGEIVSYMENRLNGNGGAKAVVSTPEMKTNDRPAIGRFVPRIVPAPPGGMAPARLTEMRDVLIIDDGRGVAPALAALLRQQGFQTRVNAKSEGNCDLLIVLEGLRSLTTEEAGMELNRTAFEQVRSVAEDFSSRGGILITVQDTGGDFGLSGVDRIQAYRGGLAALAKTAAREWPQAQVKAIDLQRGNRSVEEQARRIYEEIFSGGPELEVGLFADGRRVTVICGTDEPESQSSEMDHLKENSVFVVSGGARGVTTHCLEALVQRGVRRIALLGRTMPDEESPDVAGAADEGQIKRVLLDIARQRGEKPTPVELQRETRRILAHREVRSNLARLREAGAEVRYFAVDVVDRRAVAGALEKVRAEWGPPTGLIHAAGVIEDKLIAAKTSEQFDRVFQTKVAGLRALLEATFNDPLETILLFSSVAARTGNVGQCDYAMANEVMNKIAAAEAQGREHCLVRSLNWGPWEGGMVGPDLKSRFEEMGVPLIPIREGAQMMIRELDGEIGAPVEVVLGADPARALPGGESEWQMEISINNRNYPFLRSHSINDVPVVPVVLVLEWFSRGALALFPDLVVSGCRNLKMFRGIRLPDFESGEERVRLTIRRESQTPLLLHCELRGLDETIFYSGQLRLDTPAERPRPERGNLPVLQLENWPWSEKEIYDSQLFHGPDFQVIRSLLGVSTKGSSVLLDRGRSLEWNGGNWKTDTGVLDGGLQLALLWTIHVLGKKNLPTGVEEYISYSDEVRSGRIRCLLSGEARDGYHTRSDILFLDEEDRLIAEMRGVEMHVIPEG